jgi:hypothetical protein
MDTASQISLCPSFFQKSSYIQILVKDFHGVIKMADNIYRNYAIATLKKGASRLYASSPTL